MGKCEEKEIHKCQKLIKKCKQKKCDCGQVAPKSKDPHFHKEDLLWAFFTFKMIEEVIADPATRERLKGLKQSDQDGGNNMLELKTIQEALNITKGTITQQPGEASAPLKGLPVETSSSKPGSTK